MPSAAVFGTEERVMLVFDRPEFSHALSRILASVGLVDVVHVSQMRTRRAQPPLAVVCDIDFKSAASVRAVESEFARQTYRSVPRFVVTGPGARQRALHASAVGATGTIARPFDAQKILSAFRTLLAAKFDREVETLGETLRRGLAGAHQVVLKMFEVSSAGPALTFADIVSEEDLTLEAVRVATLAGWLDGVRRHHAQSYRHCLSVTGIAIAFAQHLGMRPDDQRRVGRAAIVHDIGKAYIPLAILDKPGELTDIERGTMREHARRGHDALAELGGFPAETLDAVLHHHEMLDGSGYPDGLRGNEVGDLVRMITISDIFSALIEERSYKTAIPRDAAYDIMSGMSGKLDPDLLRAFKSVALEL